MSFTPQELDTVIADAYEASGLEENGEFFIDAYYEEIAELETPLGKIVVEDVQGGEGDGAPIHVIISVGERYFQMDGYYSSWDSSEMDGELFEVQPKEVKVTQYERI